MSTNSDQNLSKANDEGSSHFVFIYMSWELLYLTSKVSLLSIFLDGYLHEKYQNDACIFLFKVTLIKES